jgi:hypothetical protein
MTEQEVRQPVTLREEAIQRLKKKSDFHVHLMVYVVVNGVLVLIWALTGFGFFWPMFPILGWGIGLFFHAFDTYRRPQPTEDQIGREMRRLSGHGQ